MKKTICVLVAGIVLGILISTVMVAQSKRIESWDRIFYVPCGTDSIEVRVDYTTYPQNDKWMFQVVVGTELFQLRSTPPNFNPSNAKIPMVEGVKSPTSLFPTFYHQKRFKGVEFHPETGENEFNTGP